VGAAAAAVGVRGRRRLVLAAALTLVVASVPAAVAGPSSRSAPQRPAAAVRAVVPPRPVGAEPTRVRVPTAAVDTALTGIGLDATGALLPPADPSTAGWFRGGPAPGDTGPAVLAGHVDSVAGPGAFFRIGRVAPGDPVLVTRTDGTTLRFTVTRVARYPKAAFPTAEVYGPTTDAELRLITCGGRFDRIRRSYVDDVVVFAHLDGVPPVG
jgi:Sortase domain